MLARMNTSTSRGSVLVRALGPLVLLLLAPAAAAETPTCGLGKEFHAGRRKALAERLEKGVLLVRGLPDTRDYVAFRQDKTFWYLTGVESPGAALVMDLDAGTQTLFVHEPSKRKEMWEGEIWDSDDSWVREVTGIEDVRPARELMARLDELLDEGDVVWISKHPHVALSGCYDRAGPDDRRRHEDPLDGRASREDALEAQLIERFGVEVKDCAPELNDLRLVKQPAELRAMRRAAEVGAAAMSEAMRSTRPGVGEWELDAVMSFVHRRMGAAGAAYAPIVGTGANSLVLHYTASSRRARADEVVLIDYCPEVEHYTCDITRTWPVDGSFDERQAELYDAVLDAQKAGIAAVKPGARIIDVERACRRVLDDRGFARMIRHGACHLIGMEVHDVGDWSKPLVPGVAFTVEPGLYEEATGIGIRIEDVVVVTADGCEVITSGVPKERAAVEAMVAEEGLLELD